MNSKIYPLYDQNKFHDACGVGFIASLDGKTNSTVLPLAIKALKNLSHRGGRSYGENSGDGSGILTDIPKQFYKSQIKLEKGINIGLDEDIAMAMIFVDEKDLSLNKRIIKRICKVHNVDLVAIREVPTFDKILNQTSKNLKPTILQFIFTSEMKFEDSKLFFIRKKIEYCYRKENINAYICSFSSKIIIHKGLLNSHQLPKFYPELLNENFNVKMAMFHERFSTNTNSNWQMAQPFRMIAHNGEINNIKGSRLWMKAREGNMSSKFWQTDIESIKPIVSMNGSDSESFDNTLEFMVNSGKSIFETMMIMIPDSYNQFEKYYENVDMSNKMRDFFIYHENFMKPWDGPAAIIFTDGDNIGAKMDRNGLRPLRYTITKDKLIVMASEAGIIDISNDNIAGNYHLKSEEIFGLSLDSGTIMTNKNIKLKVAKRKDFSAFNRNNFHFLERKDSKKEFSKKSFKRVNLPKINPKIYNLYKEDIDKFLLPMSETNQESIGSMGDDTPPAVVSTKRRKFYDYFKQKFAQVTNPPIDSLREKSVMSLFKYLGCEDNLLSNKPTNKSGIRIQSPVLSPRELNLLLDNKTWLPNQTIDCCFPYESSLETRISNILRESEEAIAQGCKALFINDSDPGDKKIPIPMPLITSALHHHLIKRKLRSKVSIIAISGDTIEDHNFAVLIALGASAIYPHTAYNLIKNSFKSDNYILKIQNYRNSIEKGLLKIMSKMGVSTLSSYHGSMLLHTMGISSNLINKYFSSLDSNFGGLDLITLEKNLKYLYSETNKTENKTNLEELGIFRYRRNGEKHGFSPKVFRKIQNISRNKPRPEKNKINTDEQIVYIRDFLDIRSKRKNSSLDNVEDTKHILRRFGSGGISFGAISESAHNELAYGFKLVGARSNTGEGGEPKNRYSIENLNKDINSYVKQIASGRFGVNAEYLAAGREIQIKMAQGAKPGEGGQLPGFKVSEKIAQTRFSSPNVTLISPPPHHDIYSIEDIKQLIYDLKDVNNKARVSVKLVSQPGIGVIASGLVKAGANIILVSGYDGGTGASPLGSQKHTGFPWEYGLAETHQILHANKLREFVTLRVDGGIKTSKDILIAAILGAEEFDFGTSALVSLGCVMARRCHLNNCPVGIATTDPKYELKFKGKGENIKHYLENIAESIRKELSMMGFSKLSEIIGRTDILKLKTSLKPILKKNNIQLGVLLNADAKRGLPLESEKKIRFTNYRREKTIDEKIIDEIQKVITHQEEIIIYKKVKNTDRTIGARISGHIASLFGNEKFNGKIEINLNGNAGQSLGAFLVKGLTINLNGLANDYLGKSMSNGVISVKPSIKLNNLSKHNTLIGNVALYGATGGKVYIAGSAGERFAIRNSGASAVVEGIGNHGAEYMSRGTIINLGNIGKNFGAGMTGGVVYIFTKDRKLKNYINHDFVTEANLNEKDESLILKNLDKHIFYTGSFMAKRIKKNWSNSSSQFIKIIPKLF